MAAEHHGLDLLPVITLLAAGVVGATLFKRLGLGSVLGYLAGGIAIGPFGLRVFTHPADILQVAELGVVLFLWVSGKPFGFMALLGTIALFGMVMRNSVILVDQIEQDLAAGKARTEAIVESTVRRLRPIALTAAAAVLAMVPLSRNDFFGPMAIAIMGGLIVATALTLFFLPALYAAWYKVGRG